MIVFVLLVLVFVHFVPWWWSAGVVFIKEHYIGGFPFCFSQMILCVTAQHYKVNITCCSGVQYSVQEFCAIALSVSLTVNWLMKQLTYKLILLFFVLMFFFFFLNVCYVCQGISFSCGSILEDNENDSNWKCYGGCYFVYPVNCWIIQSWEW